MKLRKYYGFIADEDCLICPKCATKNDWYQIEVVTREGYPDGYTCGYCGDTK
jgi:hypothetical protein